MSETIDEMEAAIAMMKNSAERFRFYAKIFTGAARETDGAVRSLEDCIKKLKATQPRNIDENMVRMHRDGAD